LFFNNSIYTITKVNNLFLKWKEMGKNNFVGLLAEQGLDKQTLNSIAQATGVIQRERSVVASAFFFAICLEAFDGTVSCNDIAAHIEASGGASVSKQAIHRKMNGCCLSFFQKALELLIGNKVDKIEVERVRASSRYKRLLVQDSTIISLPERLFSIFSGASNQSTKRCNARIQGVYDLLSERFVSFSIDPYSKNDLAAAPDLVLEKGDLVLRDRGYLINDEIQRHINAGADCIYRHKSKMCLLDVETEKPLNLLGMLKEKSPIDIRVKLNNKSRTVVRLVAFPVPEEVANNRRRRAKE
jgi:hypothetical protein